MSQIVLDENAVAPSAPAAGKNIIYPKTDGFWYQKDDAGVESPLSSIPRVSTEVSSATPTINTDAVDAHSITALATNITSMTTNLSGTPANFQKLIVRIKDNGTSRTIAWGASYAAMGASLPTSTTINKVLTVGFLYDSVAAKFGCVASAQEV